MTRYILSRAGEALLSILGVVTIVFFVTRMVGDPVTLLLPIGATPEELRQLTVALGLDKPLWHQYAVYLGDLLTGNFGQSYRFGRPALEVVLERMPATIQLAAPAILLGLLIGGGAGIIAALKRGTAAEFATMLLALFGQATPVFWLGIMLILLFSVHLGWLPTGGSGTIRHLILPATTLAVFVSASIARLLRSSMLDVLKEDYVRTAVSKGLAPRTVLFQHVVRNALIPVLTMVGILTGELLGGAVVTETVFGWPGVGRLIVSSIEAKDFPVIQTGVAMIASIYVIVNFVVDLLYAVVDPRVRGRA